MAGSPLVAPEEISRTSWLQFAFCSLLVPLLLTEHLGLYPSLLDDSQPGCSLLSLDPDEPCLAWLGAEGGRLLLGACFHAILLSA